MEEASLIASEEGPDYDAAWEDLPTGFSGDFSSNLGKASRELRQQERGDIRNFLKSIKEDSIFVETVHKALYSYPLFANLRQGAWYAMKRANGTCYFKSTDGHANHWDFSSTRLNMHVALEAAARQGCLIVDSTRRGKRYPDSMSKTIPIWCCVLNRLLEAKKSDTFWDSKLYLPPWIAISEQHQIERRLSGFVSNIQNVAPFIIEQLNPVLNRPLRPYWICQDDIIWEPDDGKLHSFTPYERSSDEAAETESELRFIPIICLSASKLQHESLSRQHYSWTYMQGAADDEESWSSGLTAKLFCDKEEELLAQESADAAKALVLSLVADKGNACPSNVLDDISKKAFTTVVGATGLSIAVSSLLPADTYNPETSQIIDCAPTSLNASTPGYCHIPVMAGKRENAKDYWQRVCFPMAILTAYRALLKTKRVYVCCESGTGSSVVVCLAILLSLFDSKLEPDLRCSSSSVVTKESIRVVFLRLQQYHPYAAPSRRLMKELNKFFIPADGGWSTLQRQLHILCADGKGLIE